MFLLDPVDPQESVPVLQVHPWSVHLDRHQVPSAHPPAGVTTCSHLVALTARPSLVQVMVGGGIPKASQPRVRGCFKVTVRFWGWLSSWISGGTAVIHNEGGGQVCTAVHVSTCEYESLTVDFEFGLPLHTARLVGRHALVVPAVAGRR